MTDKQVSDKLGISMAKGTISKIIKRQDQIKNASINMSNKQQKTTSRVQNGTIPLLDSALLAWFEGVHSSVSVSNEMLQHKSTEIAKLLEANPSLPDEMKQKLQKFKGSHGYVAAWKTRNHLSTIVLSGESASVDPILMEKGRSEIEKSLAGYESQDIYNLDELALFFKLQPQRVVGFKGQKGTKKSKERVTAVFCVNATGTHKLKPLIIGIY